jgi:enoyl-CoA hydratase/carnithine racemase
MPSVVLSERRGAAQWIIINRPERRNALNREVGTALIAALDAAEADPGCRAIVLTGTGEQAFCAGADLERNTVGAPFLIDPAEPRHFIAQLLARLDACGLPTIARVNGPALAGGLGLVAACDLAVASNLARVGAPECRIGLFPMMILPYLLRVVPLRALLELCLTGEPISADEARALGLFNHVVEPAELDAKIDWLIERILPGSPTALRLGKSGYRALRDLNLRDGVEYAQLMIARLAQTADAREGAAAFLEKRKPTWPAVEVAPGAKP